MMKVRDKLPQRRLNPTKNPQGADWSQHKPDLREDFHRHCAYCGSFDGFSHTWFEVDHFVPKSLFSKTGNIRLCQYDNLVYSCKFCNNIKLSKWPSKDETIPNVNNQGFVNPCSDDYDIHLYRTDTGSIRWLTDLGKWIVEVGFKFDERDYAVKLLWELNQLRKAIEILTLQAKKYPKDSEDYNNIVKRSQEYGLKYFLYRNELDEYYKTM
ncbi:HNH endonuclease [Elizabethkingia meningoseptica]|uniref:HNH endonuclease n=1 Tax=Elizabethkingia meningoseptica TaxID=238 RepID=UPI0015908881|nr:HNH endonuclease signature motif containing protein [Elizabethkingia meningoseptica]